ncbi:hypothetical protein MFLAVUS_008927 [Mucor flavus]|uniref:Insertion element IS150 protein InsJ-like helix-turn-helix domain-containing protein n=1 Tax=Mucor flavus TaxID=439312 RepID=A0ABP9Z8K3_9FUNG
MNAVQHGYENVYNEDGEKVFDPMEGVLTEVNDPNIVRETITRVAKPLSDGIHKDCSDQAREIFIDRMIEGPLERGKVTSHAKNLGINPRTAMRWWKHYQETGEVAYKKLKRAGDIIIEEPTIEYIDVGKIADVEKNKPVAKGTITAHFSEFMNELLDIMDMDQSLMGSYLDGKGNVVDEDGLEPVRMEIDEEAYPLDDITNYDSHIDLKPAEKKVKPKAVKKTAVSSAGKPDIKNVHRGNDTKEMFFFYIYEKGLTAGKAASLMNIPRRTGYNWLQQDQSILIDRLEGKAEDNDHLKENRGRKILLNEDHKKHLEETFGENASTTIDQAMDSLTTHFEGLKVSQKTVRDFMVDECALSFKKAYFYPTERNSPKKIQQRY